VSRMRRPALLWTLAALAGIVLVAGVTLAASRLSTQAIGISSEPAEAGRALAPRVASPKRTPARTATPRRAAPTPTPEVPADDHGGRGRGRGSDD
jgi:hypothetical protein